MRLRIKRRILEDALSRLNIDSVPKPQTGQITITNFMSIKKAIETLKSTGLLRNLIDDIAEMYFWDAYSDTLTMDASAHQLFETKINRLKSTIILLIENFNHLISEESEFVISIKIPNPKTFGDLTEISKSLDIIFGQTLYHPDINGSTEIKNFDMGSFWIDILVNGGAQVMHFISALAWGGAVIYKKIMEGRLIAEQVRELKISNDAKEETFKGIKELQKTTASNEATHIATEHLTNYDNEDIRRIEHAINEIAKLYTKGAEIHPSLEAPQEITEEFPKMDEISTLNSKIKLISEG